MFTNSIKIARLEDEVRKLECNLARAEANTTRALQDVRTAECKFQALLDYFSLEVSYPKSYLPYTITKKAKKS